MFQTLPVSSDREPEQQLRGLAGLRHDVLIDRALVRRGSRAALAAARPRRSRSSRARSARAQASTRDRTSRAARRSADSNDDFARCPSARRARPSGAASASRASARTRPSPAPTLTMPSSRRARNGTPACGSVCAGSATRCVHRRRAADHEALVVRIVERDPVGREQTRRRDSDRAAARCAPTSIMSGCVAW